MVAAFALTLWGLLQIGTHYPREFFPRFADEGIYALDSRDPATVFLDFDPDRINYAPAKLGYGLLLAASVAVAGANGPMYLSTLLWLATIGVAGVLAWRRLGLTAAAIATAMLSYSSLFGKYATEVGPTPEAALAFVLFWGAACTRRSWLSGLAIGWIAFIDFKWAMPAGVAYVLIEFVIETQDRLQVRLRRVVTCAVVALAVPALAALLHHPYFDFLSSYVTRHGDRVSFMPSPIFIYFLFVFGALAALLTAAIAIAFPPVRHEQAIQGLTSQRAAARALCIAAVPTVFYSLFGDLKALRFFAATYPLLVIAAASTLALAARLLHRRFAGAQFPMWRRATAVTLIAMSSVGIVHGGGDGPSHHLTLQSGYPIVLERLRESGAADGKISSYNWSITAFAWDSPGSPGSFAFVGLQDADKWIVLDPVHDRATVELRIRQSKPDANPDSMWAHQRDVLLSVSDSLFSVRSDFYASDYFLSEIVPDGISVFRRWRSWRNDANWMTVYEIDLDKLKSGWRR